MEEDRPQQNVPLMRRKKKRRMRGKVMIQLHWRKPAAAVAATMDFKRRRDREEDAEERLQPTMRQRVEEERNPR